MKNSRPDIDAPRERFLGWLPRKKPSVILFLLLVIYYALAIFFWTRMPQRLLFGWWPFHYFVYCFVYTPVLMLMLGVFYYRFWPELNRPEDKDPRQNQDNLTETHNT